MNETDDVRAIKNRWAEVYSRGAPTYGGVQFFARGGRRLVELAQIPRGASVLDVGTGRGANLFPASEQLGSDGRITGVDLADGMVRETRAEIQRRRLRIVDVHRMDAEHLAFMNGSFDRLLCGFVLYFLPQVHLAFAEFARVLKPGGVLAITGPDPLARDRADMSPVWDLLPTYAQKSDRLKRVQADNRDLWDRVQRKSWPERQAAGALSFPRQKDLEEVLQQTGFVDVKIVMEEAEIVATNEEEWWTWQWSHMPRSMLEQMEPAILQQFKDAVFEKLQSRKQPDGIHERVCYLFTLATLPADAG